MAKSNSIPTTRRSLMAGGLAAAVLPIAAMASAPALASTPDDPIFALLEAERTAHKAYVDSFGEAQRLQDAITGRVRVVIGESSGVPVFVTCGKQADNFYSLLDRYSPEERAKHGMAAKMDRDTAMKKIRRAEKRVDRVYYKHIEPFEDAHEIALDAVLEIPATTIAGVAAVMERLAEIAGPRNAYLPEDWEQDFLASAAAVLKRIAAV